MASELNNALVTKARKTLQWKNAKLEYEKATPLFLASLKGTDNSDIVRSLISSGNVQPNKVDGMKNTVFH